MDTKDNRRFQLQMEHSEGKTKVTVNSDYVKKCYLLAFYLRNQGYTGKVIDLEDGSIIYTISKDPAS